MAMTGRMLAVAVAMISVITSVSVGAGEFRVIDPMGKEDTSRCIGDPRTALCAIETFMACIYRGDESLCDKVGYDYRADYGDKVPTDYFRLSYYRFTEQERRNLRIEDIPHNMRDGPRRWLPGDLAIRLRWEGCLPNDICVDATMNDPTRPYGEGCRGFDRCGTYPFELTYIMRAEGGRWVLIADYGEDEWPVGFWKRK